MSMDLVIPALVAEQQWVTVVDGFVPVPGPPGPAGLPGSATPIVPLAFEAWPPVDPQPDTLYLRLAP